MNRTEQARLLVVLFKCALKHLMVMMILKHLMTELANPSF